MALPNPIDQLRGTPPTIHHDTAQTARVTSTDGGIWAVPLDGDMRVPIGPCRGSDGILVGQVCLLVWTKDELPWALIIPPTILEIYPVDSVFLSFDGTNPGERFGGSWVLVSKGRMLLGVDPDTPAFADSGLSGGEATHTLTIDEIPSHTHTITANTVHQLDNGPMAFNTATDSDPTHKANDDVTLGYTGGGEPHNNMPPWTSVYCWRRVA